MGGGGLCVEGVCVWRGWGCYERDMSEMWLPQALAREAQGLPLESWQSELRAAEAAAECAALRGTPAPRARSKI